MTLKGRLMRMDIIVKGAQRMDGENHEIVQQNNSAKVKPIMNQSEKEVGKFRDGNEISSAFQNRITELVKEVKDLKKTSGEIDLVLVNSCCRLTSVKEWEPLKQV